LLAAAAAPGNNSVSAKIPNASSAAFMAFLSLSLQAPQTARVPRRSQWDLVPSLIELQPL
jgi:hypothetical protein